MKSEGGYPQISQMGADADEKLQRTDGGSSATRADQVPMASDTVFVGSSLYDDAGNLTLTTNPKGKANLRAFDDVGRESGGAAEGEEIFLFGAVVFRVGLV